MDENVMEKVTELLNSPDLLKNVQAVLGQLGGQEAQKPDIVVEGKESFGDISDAVQALSSSGLLSSLTSFLSQNRTERLALLSALRPFLSAEKQSLLDSILQLLKIANILLAANIIK